MEVKKKDKFYYAQIIPEVGIYNVLEIIVRGVYDTYFVGIEKRDKRAYLFNKEAIGKIIFKNRDDALTLVLAKEKNKKEINYEVYYEEY